MEKQNTKRQQLAPELVKLLKKLDSLTVDFLYPLIPNHKQLIWLVPTVDKQIVLSRKAIEGRYRAFSAKQNGWLFSILEEGASAKTPHHNIFSTFSKIRPHNCTIELARKDFCLKCIRQAERCWATGTVYHSRVQSVSRVIDYLLKEADSVAWFLKKINFKDPEVTEKYRQMIRKVAHNEKAAWYRAKQKLAKNNEKLSNNAIDLNPKREQKWYQYQRQYNLLYYQMNQKLIKLRNYHSELLRKATRNAKESAKYLAQAVIYKQRIRAWRVQKPGKDWQLSKQEVTSKLDDK